MGRHHNIQCWFTLVNCAEILLGARLQHLFRYSCAMKDCRHARTDTCFGNKIFLRNRTKLLKKERKKTSELQTKITEIKNTKESKQIEIICAHKKCWPASDKAVYNSNIIVLITSTCSLKNTWKIERINLFIIIFSSLRWFVYHYISFIERFCLPLLLLQYNQIKNCNTQELKNHNLPLAGRKLCA